MKKPLTIAATIFTLSILVASEASAWTCVARSRTGSYGWGAGSLGYARGRALVECAVRTPRGYTCYITSCGY